MIFKISVAMDIRAYGFVDVEADTIEEATAGVTHANLAMGFKGNGHGSDDFDYSHPTSVNLMGWEDPDGEFIDLEIELDDPDDYRPKLNSAVAKTKKHIIRSFMPLVMLHGITNLPDGSTEHCEGDSPDGWNVWLRRDYHDNGAGGEVFDDDTTRERFFDNLPEARSYALELAAELQCEVEEY